jgi:hypothetical protein
MLGEHHPVWCRREGGDPLRAAGEKSPFPEARRRGKTLAADALGAY